MDEVLEAEAAETAAEPSVLEGYVSAPDAGKRFPTVEARSARP